MPNMGFYTLATTHSLVIAYLNRGLVIVYGTVRILTGKRFTVRMAH